MKNITLSVAVATLLCSCSILAPTGTKTITKDLQASIRPEEAIQRLKDGNQRYVQGKSTKRNFAAQREHTRDHQYPFAAVLGCIDSRASSEIIFDQGIGDIFNARVAGNVVNNDILGSLEYAVDHAHAKAVLVVGHTNCGAVKGLCDHYDVGHAPDLLDKIKPALASTKASTKEKPEGSNPAFVDEVAKKNVENSVKAIRKQSSVLAKLEKEGKVAIRGALYDVASGEVHFLP